MDKQYANFIEMEVSISDFLFHFASRSQEEIQKEQVETFASIFTSPQHAKMFSRKLKEKIFEYEKAFGEIILPTKSNNVLTFEEWV